MAGCEKGVGRKEDVRRKSSTAAEERTEASSLASNDKKQAREHGQQRGAAAAQLHRFHNWKLFLPSNKRIRHNPMTTRLLADKHFNRDCQRIETECDELILECKLITAVRHGRAEIIVCVALFKNETSL